MEKKSTDVIAYRNNYTKENYDRILLVLPRGYKDAIKEEAKKRGVSVNALLREIIEKEMPQMP